MKKILVLFGICLISLAIYVTFFAPKADLISPLCTSSASAPEKCLQTRSSLGDTSPSYIILGFAPYWNLRKLSPESLESITHFAYFNLHLNGDGSLYTNANRREEDPAYTNYKRLVAGIIDYQNKPLILTFMPESQSALAESISSSINRQNTINTILATLEESKAMGVNIDYEPLGDISPLIRNNFSLFIQELRAQTIKENKQVSISIYGSSAIRPRLWDLSSLAEHVDYFVVMTYDYTMPGSNSAGPNAPLRGSGNQFEHDVIKNIAEITKLVPSKKILLGIPFYGYEWDTIDESKYSPVESKGSVASLERIDSLLNEKTLELIWDRNTLTPYGISTESGQTSQIYFENETSIRLKMEFVKSANLGGIAIWALGYEGSNSWVWPTINKLNL
jgi:spore germination protein YaaH